MTPAWHVALGYALTGAELDLPHRGRPDVESLVSQLEAAGWPRQRILDHARTCAAAEVRWPHQVPAELRHGCGAAQFQALLGAARAELQLVALESRPPSGRTRLSPDEERLLREVPPHHGV